MLLVSPLIFFFSIKEQNRCVVTVWILKFPLLYLLLFFAPIDPIRILSFPIYVFLGRARRTVAARPLTIGLSTYCGTVCTTVTIATIGTIWHCAWKMYGKPTCLHTPIWILSQKRLSFFYIPHEFFFSFPLHTIHPRHLAPSAKCYSAYWEGLCYGERKNECNSWKWFYNSRSIVGSNERQQTMLPVDNKKRSLFRRLHSRFFCKFPPILKYWWITIKMSWKIN